VGQTAPEPAATATARRIALQMVEERGRGALLVGVSRVDTALERLLQAVLLPTARRSDPFRQFRSQEWQTRNSDGTFFHLNLCVIHKFLRAGQLNNLKKRKNFSIWPV